jgi:hypothetical protein
MKRGTCPPDPYAPDSRSRPRPLSTQGHRMKKRRRRGGAVLTRGIQGYR